MNKLRPFTSGPGFSTVEALVALLILVVGLLAIASYQSDLLSVGGQSKARSEAVQLAEDKLEGLRQLIQESSYTAIASNTTGESITGTNATFTRKWTVTSATHSKTVNVAVSWTDKTGTPQVALTSVVTWNDPTLSAALAYGKLPGGDFVNRPMGGANYGGDNRYTPGSIPGSPDYYDDGSGPDVNIYSHDGIVELIDTSTGDVLLTSTTGTFGTISGFVYIENFNGAPDVNDVYATVSDVGVCTRSVTNPSTITDADSNTIFSYFPYKCYVGAGWYGNVDFSVTGINRQTAQTTCVGDPVQSDTGLSDSKHAQVGDRRSYRGYQAQTDENGDPLFDADGNRIFLSAGMTAGGSFSGQEFLYTKITGTVTDADCLTKLELSYPSDTVFAGNAGGFVCMSASCPSPLPADLGTPVSAVALTISGAFTGGSMDSIDVVGSSGSQVGSCTVGSSTYSCTIYDLGTGWSGYIQATAATDYAVTSSNPVTFGSGTNDIYPLITADLSGVDFTLQSTAIPQITTISGSVTRYGNPLPTITSFSLPGGACTFNSGAYTYVCTTASYSGSWTGTITVNTAKTLCADTVTLPASGIVNSSADSVTFTGVTSTALTRNLNLAKNGQSCP